MENRLRTLFVIIVIVALLGCTSSPEVDRQANVAAEKPIPTIEKDGLVLSWSIDIPNEKLHVYLTNHSNARKGIRTGLTHFEAKIVVMDGNRYEYYEEGFFRLLTTSTWFNGTKELKPSQKHSWDIPFTEIEEAPYCNKPFAVTVKTGEVYIEEFWGFRD